jgi:hypothetical protein
MTTDNELNQNLDENRISSEPEKPENSNETTPADLDSSESATENSVDNVPNSDPKDDAQAQDEVELETEAEVTGIAESETSAEDVSAVEVIPEVLSEAESEVETVADVESRIATTSENRQKITSEIEEIEVFRENLSIEIERFISVREDLNQWIGARRESFAWKLTEALRSQEKQLTEDEATVRDFASNEPELDTEFGAKTRRWVMKWIGFPALIFSVIFGLMEYIRSNSGYVDVPDPNNPAVTVQVREFDRWLLENLGLTHLDVTFILVVAMIFIFFGVLFAYSRRSSEFRQIVAEEAELTKVMENAIHSIKIERERIDSLHPQVPQILELLSLGLHQPWVIDERYLSFQGELPDASKLPESLDISVPTEKSSRRVFPQLVLHALNELQTPGWREQAFENSIQRLAEHSGFGESGTALRELDHDQRRSGKRQMLISLEGKDLILKEIGEELVRDFAATVQAKVLPVSQPEVISLRPDILAHLQLSNNLVDNSEESVSPWEQRLSDIAGAGSPWAPGTFSSRGQLAARHERKPSSVFIASDRTSQFAHSEVVAFKEVDAGTRPFEVSIRVDLSEWCHPEELAIFEDYQPSAEELRARELREAKGLMHLDQSTEKLNHDDVAF